MLILSLTSISFLHTNLVGNGVHFQSSDEVALFFLFDAHLDDLRQVVKTTQCMMNIVQQSGSLANKQVLVWIPGFA